MQSIFGIENLANEAVTKRLIQNYEKEIQDFARVSNLVRQSFPERRAWYCPLLVRLGNTFVVFGTRLMTRYSVQTRLQVEHN